MGNKLSAMRTVNMISLLFVLLLSVTCTQDFSDLHVNSELPTKEMFKKFHQLHEKEYSINSQEALNRYRTFKQNLRWCREQNQKLGKTIYGITQFTDMTHEEFTKTMTVDPITFQKSLDDLKSKASTFLGGPILNVEEDLPNLKGDVDWRGYIDPPRDQKRCGSCWAFTAIAALEAGYKRKTGSLTNFSEQYLVNCDTYDNGCNGGHPINAYVWTFYNGAIPASSLPYTANRGACDSSLKSQEVKGLIRAVYIEKGLNNWKKWVGRGPVAVAMDGSFDGFKQYKPSNFDAIAPSGGCGGVNHAVVAMGYVTEGGVEYAIVRNSWGTQWGYEGNFKIPINDSCHITDEVYPFA